MMTGFGQFGPIEMGGKFTVVKVRKGLAANDYGDPGWFRIPGAAWPTNGARRAADASERAAAGAPGDASPPPRNKVAPKALTSKPGHRH